jgi:hypothetical protein
MLKITPAPKGIIPKSFQEENTTGSSGNTKWRMSITIIAINR